MQKSPSEPVLGAEDDEINDKQEENEDEEAAEFDLVAKAKENLDQMFPEKKKKQPKESPFSRRMKESPLVSSKEI
jgi:hypothetical protein